jgi:hypothetical protein
MAREFSLTGFAGFLTKAVVHYEVEKAHALKKAAKVLQEESQRVIGTYDYGWPELAESTKADRLHKGYTENDPLLRSGEMRESIEIGPISGGALTTTIEVGSNNDKAVWQELGTDRIPARSFLGLAAVKETPEIIEILGGSIPLIKLP